MFRKCNRLVSWSLLHYHSDSIITFCHIYFIHPLFCWLQHTFFFNVVGLRIISSLYTSTGISNTWTFSYYIPIMPFSFLIERICWRCILVPSASMMTRGRVNSVGIINLRTALISFQRLGQEWTTFLLQWLVAVNSETSGNSPILKRKK